MIKYNPEAMRVLRMSKGMNPNEFAEAIGGKTSRQNVYNWESGKLPSTKALIAIANKFGIGSLDLFFTVTNYHGNNEG